ncbi:NOP14 [Symbiodinium necroappetens]|uniref:NOP14 protein n=1 Tax=Symbiodinium necroappetens TaxID=1628268 RepID=A0A812Y3Q8_9DINO|nr:NOP14 [Symbiodinium necroappetens]
MGRTKPKPKPTARKGGPGPESNPSNPYDSFQNKRRRHEVLNERVKGERRNIARSRASATAERTQQLLKEKLTVGRSSKFRDARLGGDEGKGTSVQRLVRLRQREAKKSFNLGQEEDLKVRGRPLSSMADSELREGTVGSDEEAPDHMDDIVAMGRARKEEAARAREEHERQRTDLDKGFGDIMGELSFQPPKAKRLLDRPEPDSYDKLLKELVFDRKATATERTKTPEEIAREKAEKLEALERKRLARADGLAEDVADADEDSEAEDLQKLAEATGGDEEVAEEGEEEEEKEEDEELTDGKLAQGQEQSDALDNADDADGAAGEVDEDDRLGEDCIKLMTVADAEKVHRSFMKNAKGEEGLPFAPECPQDRLSVERLLSGRDSVMALKLVQRVRTRASSALSAENRGKLKGFLLALLDYAINVIARSDGDVSSRGMTIVFALRRPILELAGEYPQEVTDYFLELLRALGPETAPKARELAALKLVPLLFPVTDFQHPVVTPATLLADHWASQLARLGADIQDLVSEGSMLLCTLYELLSPGGKFCSSFFQLGVALLQSSASSAAAGRQQAAAAAEDLAAILARCLERTAEQAPASAAVLLQEVVRPALAEIVGEGRTKIQGALQRLEAVSKSLALQGCFEKTLRLFDAGPVQIKMLDPIFHEEGDRPLTRGMEASATKQLQRKLNQERRAAARQLARDAAVVQQLQSQKQDQRRKAGQQERKRVRQLMDVEKQELKQMATEFDKSMNTMFGSYSRTKERKKANRRMGGNATAENPKEARPKPAKEKGNAVDTDAKGPKKAKRSGGKKSKFKR